MQSIGQKVRDIAAAIDQTSVEKAMQELVTFLTLDDKQASQILAGQDAKVLKWAMDDLMGVLNKPTVEHNMIALQNALTDRSVIKDLVGMIGYERIAIDLIQKAIRSWFDKSETQEALKNILNPV